MKITLTYTLFDFNLSIELDLLLAYQVLEKSIREQVKRELELEGRSKDGSSEADKS